jgi:hypothetical protein
MSILSALKQQTGSLDELAKLPQSEIMQMAQRKEIAPEMVAPILSRKAEIMDSAIRTRQASAGAQGKPPTVMEGLMAKNAVAEAPQIHEAGIAQLPIPERQYAGGGIIAFAEGDYVDGEDREDEDEYAEYERALATAMGQSQRLQAMRGEKQADAMPKEITQERVTHKVQPATGDHPYKEMVAKDAVKYGIDPNISTRLLQNETGGLKNPEAAKSKAGAVGIAQFMPATAKQYGIDPTDPKQSSDAMNKHVHHLMKQYGDPQLVAIAYNWGEGNTNKWLASGANPDKLPRETQEYLHKFMHKALAQGGEVQSYASGGSIESKSYADRMKAAFGYHPHLGPAAVHYMTGGEVQHYAKGDLVYNNETNEYEPDVEREGLGDKFLRTIGYNEGFKKVAAMPGMDKASQSVAAELAKRNGVKPAPQAKPTPAPAQTNPPVAAASTPTPPLPEQDIGFGVGNFAPQGEEVKQAASAPQAKENDYQRYIRMQEERMNKIDKQKQSDQNMALIAAGLGILGGDSPYAAVNIGKGALHGVQHMSESAKQRAAEENAGMRNIGQLLRYKELGDIADENRALRKEAGQESREEKARSNRAREEANMGANLQRWRQSFMSGPERLALEHEKNLDKDEAARVRAKAESEYARHPNTIRMNKALGLDMSDIPDYSGYSIKKKQ